jgi:hypothetical protein
MAVLIAKNGEPKKQFTTDSEIKDSGNLARAYNTTPTFCLWRYFSNINTTVFIFVTTVDVTV